MSVVAALLPMPRGASTADVGKDRSQPFPCQDRPCGCRSAAQCKKSCCCFTRQQKLAWASRHGVSPEPFVDGLPKSRRPAETPAKSCCVAVREVESTAISSGGMCHAPPARRVPVQILIGIWAHECQGLSFAVGGWLVFVLPPVSSLKMAIEPAEEVVVCVCLPVVEVLSEPPVPPPRPVVA
ncbi:MAG: hypothetical protein JSS02_34720 [Planctomycetes bacterium]|nr:hypothetical protein [Planctomycetota bacterium]